MRVQLPLRALNIKKNEMKIDISYIETKHYDRKTIMQWFWWFERYTYVKGFKMRIFGWYINVRENNATEKLIKLAREKSRC